MYIRILTESLIELAEYVLKNNIFEYNLSFYKQLRGSTIGTKMALPCAIIFSGDLEVRVFSDCDILPLVWWRSIDDIFMFRQYDKKELEKLLETA